MKFIAKSAFAHLFIAASLLMMPFTVSAAIAQRPSLIEELDLTSEQRSQLEDIFQQRRAEIDSILTDVQQQQFRDAYRELQDFQAAVEEIDNLNEAQQQDIQAVLEGSREDIQEVLSEEQLAELREILQERRQNR